MEIALLTSKRSYAKRLKVGCVIVKNHSIISFGWNGMPTGYDNCCEDEVDGKLITKPEVQHAELNAIAKLAQNGYSSEGAKIFYYSQPLPPLLSSYSKVWDKRSVLPHYLPELRRTRILKKSGIKVEQL